MKRRATINDLRLAIGALPRATRMAMLEGIRSNDIIAGAYSSEAGICPMLAAHRGGGRTSSISFARAWDAFVFRGERRKAVRRATDRELRVLRAHLEASLFAEEALAPHGVEEAPAPHGVEEALAPHGVKEAPIPSGPERPARHGREARSRRRTARVRTPDSTGPYLLCGGIGGESGRALGRGSGRAEH